MIRRASAALLVLVLLSSGGCYRTVYRNLRASNAPPVVEDTPPNKRPRTGWQSYFMYGWFPLERSIDAFQQCGGDGHVAMIETEQTFGQGAIAWAVMLGFYLGIYSPWSGHVTCDH